MSRSRSTKDFAKRISGSVAISAIYLAASSSVWAQLPVARLFTLFPPGGKAGTTLEVAVSGADLDDASQLLFSNPKISAKPKIIGSTGQPEANKFTITIAADVSPGIYEARFVGRFGVSNPRKFVVGDLPEVISPPTNHTGTSAAEVAPACVVNGRADPNAADNFKFAAKKGQRLLIECLAREIDSRLDESMVLRDSSGREIQRSRRGGLLDFTAPADGQYLLRIHDFTYRGGDEYFYRLTIGAGPHIDYIFPPAGLPATKGKFDLYGRNLPGAAPAKELSVDGKPLEKLNVEIEFSGEPSSRPLAVAGFALKPASSVLDGLEYRLRTPQGVSNPVFVSLATAPVVLEQEPNNKPIEAQKVVLPCEIAGQFHPAGDADWFTFDANKDEVYWVEVFSDRLGLPTDPFVFLQRVTKNEKGEETTSTIQELYDSDTNIGGPEFNTTTRDPAGRFEVKESGTYRLEVRDLFGRLRSSPRHVYRLSLRKESPDFRIVALPQPPPPVNKDAKEALLWTPLLRRGETIPVKVLALRRDNFNGEIELGVEGLPKGVTFAPDIIEANQNSKLLLLTATDDAENWWGPITIVGKAKVGDSQITRAARAASLAWTVPDYNNEAISSRLTDALFLAVSSVESTPITVESAERKIWEAAAGAKLQIPLKVLHRGEFNEGLKLKATGVGALDSLKELDVDGKTNAATLEIDLAQQKLPPGTHTFCLQAQTRGKYRNDPEGAKQAEAASKQAEKLAADLMAEVKKAEEALVAVTQTAEAADAEAKAGSEKLVSARSAAEQAPADEELVSARDCAEEEAQTLAEKARLAADARDMAVKAVEEATAKAKAAEKKKATTAERAKQANQRAQPKDVTVTIYSAPISIRVKEEVKQ